MTTEHEVLSRGSEMGATTITRLEGLAVVTALQLAQTKYFDHPVRIHTDASLWSLRYAQLPMLADHGWRKPSGKAVKEVDILSMMWDYYDAPRVEVVWVPGHSGIVGNMFADRAAREARDLVATVVGRIAA